MKNFSISSFVNRPRVIKPHKSILYCLLLLLALSVFINDAHAALPSPGASCSTSTANAYACYANGCYKCVSNTWTTQPMYVGEQSASCDSTTKQQMRYNTSTDNLEFCNGTAWAAFAASAGGTVTPPVGSGFFVLSSTTWNGNLGGRSGGNSKCLTELTTNTNWKYYSLANSRGLLIAGKVFALLCDTYSSCNLPNAVSTTYYFSKVNDMTAGGGSFTTDGSGNGPNNNANWSAVNYFNGAYRYWFNTWGFASTNTTWSSTGGNDSCGGTWSSSSGVGDYGESNNIYKNRFTSSTVACSTSLRMICFVNP